MTTTTRVVRVLVAGLIISTVRAVAHAAPQPAPSAAILPTLVFERFKLVDGFPYAEFSLVNGTVRRYWFLAADAKDPRYTFEVRMKKSGWQDATPGTCGLTQYHRRELPPKSSTSFAISLPILSSVFRIKVPIYETQEG